MLKISGRFRVVEDFERDLFIKVSEEHVKSPKDWIEDYRYSVDEFEEVLNDLKSNFEKDRLYLSVFEYEKDLLGFLWGELRREENSIYINSLWVDKDYRRLGVGRFLKEQLTIYGMRHKFSRIDTTVSRKNVSIINLNRSLGYEEVESHNVFDFTLFPVFRTRKILK